MQMVGEYTQLITLDEAFAEYQRNPEFNKLINSGLYVYHDTEEMYVLNDPKIAYIDNGEIVLTQEAEDSLSEYALTFRIYRTGSLFDKATSFDKESEGKIGKELRFDGELRTFHDPSKIYARQHQFSDMYYESSPELTECKCEEKGEKHCRPKKENCPVKTWDLMGHIINLLDMNRNDFIKATNLGTYMYEKIKRTRRRSGPPERETLMAFVVGLNVPLGIANELFEKARKHLLNPKHSHSEDAAYIFALHSLYGGSMHDKNEFFIEHGAKPLGSKESRE